MISNWTHNGLSKMFSHHNTYWGFRRHVKINSIFFSRDMNTIKIKCKNCWMMMLWIEKYLNRGLDSFRIKDWNENIFFLIFFFWNLYFFWNMDVMPKPVPVLKIFWKCHSVLYKFKTIGLSVGKCHVGKYKKKLSY